MSLPALLKLFDKVVRNVGSVYSWAKIPMTIKPDPRRGIGAGGGGGGGEAEIRLVPNIF